MAGNKTKQDKIREISVELEQSPMERVKWIPVTDGNR